MLTALSATLVMALQPAVHFRTFGPYDPAVPTPESVLGYAVGERHTVFFDQFNTIREIAGASPTRIRRMPYGKSTEGRPLQILAISSPENMARLDDLQLAYSALARGESPKNLSSLPALVWVNQCIHGDETASFESAMELIYTLAASRQPALTKTLENVVVIVNPVYNPDGHERYVVAYNAIPNGTKRQGAYDRAVPSAFMGRSNHYRFDMNRDRISMSQAETRQEVAAFLQWNPHVYVDQHGQVETYFFPPVQQSVNSNVDRERYNKWAEVFGRATAAQFDQLGWTYFIRDSYDLFNACYLDAHASLMGAIGMTHETDGGRVMASEAQDGRVLTMKDGALKHFYSALAVIESASKNKNELLKSYVGFKKRSVSGEHAGKMKRVILQSPDHRVLGRIQEHLHRTGVDSKVLQRPYSDSAYNYWNKKTETSHFAAGALLIDMNQPQGPLAKALLEPSSSFEPEFIKRQMDLVKARAGKDVEPEIDSFEFYDTTAWSLPYAYGVEAHWTQSAPDARTMDSFSSGRWEGDSTVGYILPYKDQNDVLFVAKALQAGIRVSMLTKRSVVGNRTYLPGTFVILAARNEPGFERKLRELAADCNAWPIPAPTSWPDEGRHGFGSETVVHCRKPEIGVLFGNAGSLAGGEIWYLMEKEFKLPFDSLITSVGERALDRYTTLVVPEGATGLNRTALKAWVQRGGTLVLLGGADWSVGSDGFGNLESQTGESSLPGSFFKGTLDPKSFLAYGATQFDIAVPVEGRRFWKSGERESAVQIGKEVGDTKLLSGWTWEDSEKAVAGTSWVHVMESGSGRVVAFATDPTFRAQYPGLYKLVLNAMILGPSQ